MKCFTALWGRTCPLLWLHHQACIPLVLVLYATASIGGLIGRYFLAQVIAMKGVIVIVTPTRDIAGATRRGCKHDSRY